MMQYRSLLILEQKHYKVVHCDLVVGVNHFNQAVCEVLCKRFEDSLTLHGQAATLCISSYQHGNIDIHGIIDNIELLPLELNYYKIKLHLVSHLSKLKQISGPMIQGPMYLQDLLVQLLAQVAVNQNCIEFIAFENHYIEFEWYAVHESALDYFYYLVHKYKLFFIEHVAADYRKVIFSNDVQALNNSSQTVQLAFSEHQQQLFPAYYSIHIKTKHHYDQLLYQIETNNLICNVLDSIEFEHNSLFIYQLNIHFEQACISTNVALINQLEGFFHKTAPIRKLPQFTLANITLNKDGELLDQHNHYTVNLICDNKATQTPIPHVAAIVPSSAKEYGWFFPFELNTQVVLSPVLNDAVSFYIVGALPVSGQYHFVSADNVEQLGFNTPSGQTFNIDDKLKRIHFYTQDQHQEIELNESTEHIIFNNKQGDIEFNTAEQMNIHSEHNQHHTANQQFDIEVKENLHCTSDNNIDFKSATFGIQTNNWQANTSQTKWKLSDIIDYQTDSISIAANHAIQLIQQHNFQAQANCIEFEATQSLTLQLAGTSIILNPKGCITVNSPGIVFAAAVVASCNIAGL